MFKSQHSDETTIQKVRFGRRICSVVLYLTVIFIFSINKTFDAINTILKLWMSAEMITFVMEFAIIENFESSLLDHAEKEREILAVAASDGTMIELTNVSNDH